MVAVSETIIMGLAGSGLAALGFLGKRTLSNIDKRIKRTEVKHEEILQVLAEIEKSIVELSTRLEFLDRMKQE